MTDPCEHGIGILEHCRVCDDHDECQPPPSFGYRDRTDGDEMLPLPDGPGESRWLVRLMIGAFVAAAVAVLWGCR